MDVPAVLAGLAAVISAVAALVTAWRTARLIGVMGHRLDGRLDELLAAEREKGRAQGVIEGEERHRQRHGQAPPAT